MSAFSRFAWPAVLALFLLGFAASPRAQERAAPDAADARSPEQWLHIVQQAARRLDYAGTIVFTQGSEVRTSRIVHVFDGRISHERLQPMDGRPREFIRRADEVKCLIPESRRVVVERRARPESFPGLASTSIADLLKNYSVKLAGRERVGGFDCQVLHIEPKQPDRYGYRLWVDRDSGLLLRVQTVDAGGNVLEQMAFADVRIGGVDREQLKPSWSTEGWRVDEASHRPVDPREQGWKLAPPAGFKPLYSVRRPSGAGSMLQTVYSDGLASLSVFIEPAAAAGDEPLPSAGSTHAYARRVGDALVTVVGEVPAETVRAVANAAERIAR